MAKNTNRDGRAPSQRQLRVGELIRRTLSDILNRGEIHDPDLNRLSISVGEVRVTPDLRVATAYILPLMGNDKDEALSIVRRNRYELRHAVTKQMTLRFSPEIRYELDLTHERMEETERLLSLDNVKRDLESGEDE